MDKPRLTCKWLTQALSTSETSWLEMMLTRETTEQWRLEMARLGSQTLLRKAMAAEKTMSAQLRLTRNRTETR